MQKFILDANHSMELTQDSIRVMNALDSQAATLGLTVDVQYLTYILSQPVRQKYTTVALADYASLDVGTGAWAPSRLKNISVGSGDSFESGFISTGADATRLAEVKSQMGTMTFPIRVWAKSASWDIPSLKKSALAKYDIVAETEYQRRKNWDLGIQSIFFNGNNEQGLGGLFTNTNVLTDTSILGANAGFGVLNEADYQAAIAKIMGIYDQRSNYTAVPNRFVMPADDYTSMASAASATFPMITKLEYMQNMFKQQTGRDDFRIMKCPYAKSGFDGRTKSIWALYDSSSDALEFSIPVDYTATLYNSMDNFYFNSVAYGEIGGMCIYRPAELLYLQNTI